MISHWNLRWQQGFRDLQDSLKYSSWSLIWTFLVLPLISISSSPLCWLFGIVSNAQTTIGITVNFMFHSLFCSLVRSKYLSFRFLLFSFIFYFLFFAETAKSIRGQFFFLNIIITSFSYQLLLMVFNWRLSDSKFLKVFRTLLFILADFKRAVVWLVSYLPLIST